jgi:hypothetical protein
MRADYIDNYFDVHQRFDSKVELFLPKPFDVDFKAPRQSHTSMTGEGMESFIARTCGNDKCIMPSYALIRRFYVRRDRLFPLAINR